jgi:hypothetical protein
VKKHLLIISVFLLLGGYGFGQTNDSSQNTREDSIRITVHLNFTVNRKSKLKDIKIDKIEGDTSYSAETNACKLKAIKLLNEMDGWTPGIQKGKTVDVQYNLPMRFVLPKEK